jgi:hypothetical protein
MSSRELTAEFQDNYKYAHDYWAPFVKDAEVYTLAASGYTWSDAERKQLVKEGREALELNIMRRPIQFFDGWIRDNINSVVYGPIEGSDQKTADQFTKISTQIWDKGGGYCEFLDSCSEMLKSGMSLCGIQMDYSKDIVNGDISFYKRTFNSFVLDPTFSKLDLSDCSFAITRDLISRDYAKQLLKDVSDEEIDSIASGFRDNKFMSYHPQFTTFSRNKNLLAYDQYYRRTTRERRYLVDLDSGFSRDITDIPTEDYTTLKQGMKRLQDSRQESELIGEDISQFPNVEIRSVQRPYVELSVMLNGEHVFTGEDQTGVVDMYPFAPVVCYMEPSIWMASQRVQGLASCQWSAQRQFNKRHMKIIDMMDSEISTGYKYIIGSVKDPSDLQQSGQNRLIGVVNDPDAAPQGLDSVQQLHGGGANPALIQYQEILDKLTLTLGNVTEATLGMDQTRNTLVSGRLAQVQIAQNLTSNRKMLDNVDTAQMLLGSVVLKAIQAKYPVAKIERMINEEPTEQFYDSQFEQFDVSIKEGVRSKTQKDAYYYELVNLKRDGIVDVPQSEILRALQMSGMSDLEEAIQAQQEQQAEQQAKIDEQERLAMEMANAQKEQSLALAQERRARVLSDVALASERSSESEENRASAALKRAQTITEIASLEDDRILKVLNFVNMLEQQEASDREDVNNRIQATSDQINSETQGSAENQQLQQAQQQINQEVSNADGQEI